MKTQGEQPKHDGKKQNVPTEAQEQAKLFEWINLNIQKYPELALCFHVPNGGSRHQIEAARLKAQGVKPGVPDIFLPVPRGGYHGLFIELKRQKGGRLSNYQKIWLTALGGMGYAVYVCFGCEEAKREIIKYLGRK